MNNQKVSVIITTKNEAKNIGRLLSSIKKQIYSSIEIIVIDNNSTDETGVIARKFTRKVRIFGPERSAQRNFGAMKSSGQFLMFLDADMELSSGVIRECVDALSKDENIGAAVIPEESIAKGFWEKVKAFERSFYNEEGDNTIEAARFFRKEVYKRAGGYDESITGPEDWDLPEIVRDLGYRVCRIKSKIYHYERINSPISLAKKKFYYALKSHRYLKKRNVSVISSKTIYFLRPVFYNKWKKLISHPVLTIAMIIMFVFELGGGGMGYLIGRYKNI